MKKSDTICHIDIESFSPVPLTKTGVYKYAESPETEILVCCYAFDEEPVHVWIPVENLPKQLKNDITAYAKALGGRCYTGLECPADLRKHIESGAESRAHNANFERTMLNGSPGQKINFPFTTIQQWTCTAVKAAAHGLPRDLARLAKALKTKHQKDLNGKAAMMAVTKPRKPSKNNPSTRWTPENAPDKFLDLYTYCIDDVRTERACDDEVPDIRPAEKEMYDIDQEINDRGWMIDQPRVADVQFLVAEYKKYLADKFRKITGLNPTQTGKFADWVREEGVDIPNLQAQTIRDTLKRKNIPKNVRNALRIRSLHEMKAPAKYTAMERAVCSDGALRGMFMYFGASTGRWSSRIVQLQNLFRPIIEDAHHAIEAFRTRSLDWLKTLYSENPMKIFSSCVRGMLIPRPGRDILAADFNSIEARIVVWMAGQEDMLEIFRTHGLAYEYTAAKIYKMSTDLPTLKSMKKSFEMRRFIGKIAVLALGYQGGQAAFVKMSKQFGVEISIEEAEKIKNDWRAANPKVADWNDGLWSCVNEAAKNAILNPGTTVKTHKLMFRVVGDFLYMRLPSGRKLAYYKPVVKGREIRFMGINTHTGQWCWCNTYGGKLVQNAAEGIAYDLIAESILKLRKTGLYPLIGTVHDEVVTEPKEGEGSVDEVITLMCDTPAWANGLPVHADGFRTKRYRK